MFSAFFVISISWWYFDFLSLFIRSLLCSNIKQFFNLFPFSMSDFIFLWPSWKFFDVIFRKAHNKLHTKKYNLAIFSHLVFYAMCWKLTKQEMGWHFSFTHRSSLTLCHFVFLILFFLMHFCVFFVFLCFEAKFRENW